MSKSRRMASKGAGGEFLSLLPLTLYEVNMSGKYNKGKRKPSHVQTKRSPANEYHWRIQTDYAKRQLQRKQYFKVKHAA